MATVAPGRHEGLTGAADDSIDPSARKRRGPLDDIAGDDKAIQSQVSVKCRGGRVKRCRAAVAPELMQLTSTAED